MKKLRGAAALAAIGLVAALAGCAPTSQGTGSSDKTSLESTTVEPGKYTLNVLDSNSSGAANTWQEDLNKEFMKKYPNITIKRTTETFANVQQTVRLRLASNNPPDVVVANQGWGAMATLAKDKLILPLNNFAKLYKWNSRFPSSVMQQQMISSDFKSLGNGELYGVPSAVTSIVGVYYNRALLSEIGGGVPKTLSEFEHDLAVAKSKGILPIQFGDQDQVPVTLPLYMVADAQGKQKAATDFTYGIGKTTLSDTGWTQAAATVQSWVKKGYFTPSFSGINSNDANQAFFSGKGAFLIYWSGGLGESAAQDKNLGFFVLDSASGSPLTNGSCNAPYSISSRTKHPNAAAAYLNLMASKQAAELGVKLGLMPQLVVPNATDTSDPLVNQENSTNNRLLESNGYLPYFDWVSLTFLTTLEREGQDALALQITPKQLVSALQADVNSFRANGNS